jgi:hypothetical protein
MNRDASPSVLVVWLLGLAGCTSSTTDNFTNPPPGPPSTCTPVAALAGCAEGGFSYSCTSDRPDDGDPDFVCDPGVAGIGGTTSYCCARYGQWASDCAPATVPGCGVSALGFSCTGLTTPDEADPYLVCSGALPAGDAGATAEYCCVLFDSSPSLCQCASFDGNSGLCGVAASATGCSGAAIGFTCVPGHSPVEVNPLLECAMPGGDGGSTLASDGGPHGGASYCCGSP